MSAYLLVWSEGSYQTGKPPIKEIVSDADLKRVQAERQRQGYVLRAMTRSNDQGRPTNPDYTVPLKQVEQRVTNVQETMKQQRDIAVIQGSVQAGPSPITSFPTYEAGREVPVSGGVAQKLKEAGVIQTNQAIDTRPKAIYVVSQPKSVDNSQKLSNYPESQESNNQSSLTPLQQRVKTASETARKFQTLGGVLEVKPNDPGILRFGKSFGQTFNIPGNLIGFGIMAGTVIGSQYAIDKSPFDVKNLELSQKETMGYVTSGEVIKEPARYFYQHPEEALGIVAGGVLLANAGRISSSIKRKISPNYVPLEETGLSVIKENAMKPLGELSKLEGEKITTVHSTLSDKLNLKVGKELPLEAQPEGTGGLRKSLTQYSFYKSTEGIRGQFIGIGEAGSETQLKFSALNPKRTALIFREDYITPNPKGFNTARGLLEWQNLPSQSGKTFLAPENVFKMTMEEQVNTPAKLASMGRVGSTLKAVKGPLTGKYTTYLDYYKPPKFLEGTKLGNIIKKIPKSEYDINFVEARTKPVSTPSLGLAQTQPVKQSLNLGEYSRSYGKTKYISLSELSKPISTGLSLKSYKIPSSNSMLTSLNKSSNSIFGNTSLNLSSSMRKVQSRISSPRSYSGSPASPNLSKTLRSSPILKVPSYNQPSYSKPSYSPPSLPKTLRYSTPYYKPPTYPRYNRKSLLKMPSLGRSKSFTLSSDRMFSQKTKYLPSLTALVYNIKAPKSSRIKKQGLFTGMELRPL